MSIIEEALPPAVPIKLLRSEADFYGASHNLAIALKRKYIPRSYADWKHGWSGKLPLRYPSQLFFSEDKSKCLLVHTSEQEKFLRERGYHNAHAVGMPFLYAMKSIQPLERRERALLVMPPHISKYASPNYDEMEYVDSLSVNAKQFNHALVCITGECEKQGRWRKSFEGAGYKVIVGADVFDANALNRMAMLFSAFDTVTSPDLGSHIVYAALSGCRISVFGKIDRAKKSDFLNEPYYQRHPEVLELAFSDERRAFESVLRERFECQPQDAKTHVSWAANEAGLENMVDDSQLAYLLGWGLTKQIKGLSQAVFRRVSKLI